MKLHSEGILNDRRNIVVDILLWCIEDLNTFSKIRWKLSNRFVYIVRVGHVTWIAPSCKPKLLLRQLHATNRVRCLSDKKKFVIVPMRGIEPRPCR